LVFIFYTMLPWTSWQRKFYLINIKLQKINISNTTLSNFISNTVKSVVRGHTCDKEKRLNSYEIFYDRTWKGWPFNTGDGLIEVTTWAGLIVYNYFKLLNLLNWLTQNMNWSCFTRLNPHKHCNLLNAYEFS
jgi:hypothetical protein